MTQDTQNESTPAATGAVTVTLDAQETLAGLESLTEFLERTLQIRNGLLHLLDSPGNVGSLNFHDLAAPATSPLRAAFQPTQGFLDLVTAVRAGNIHLRTIEETLTNAHFSPPSVQRTANGQGGAL